MKSNYEVLTDEIIALLESGTVPWKAGYEQSFTVPKNYVTRKNYRGVNWLVLASRKYKYDSFLTFKQAQDAGLMVKKGEKGHPVFFFSTFEKEDKKTGEKDSIPVLKRYTVFNIAQTDADLSVLDSQDTIVKDAPQVLKDCESIVANYVNPPKIDHDSTGCMYRPSTDSVHMVELAKWDNAEAYYSTLFHELVHSTGHDSRLKRFAGEKVHRFGNHAYSKEELIAEIGSTFLCAHAGIKDQVLENNAAYIEHWLKALKNDKRMIFEAASKAQKACDLILNVKFE
jgi:antirestriction protein ArdC